MLCINIQLPLSDLKVHNCYNLGVPQYLRSEASIYSCVLGGIHVHYDNSLGILALLVCLGLTDYRQINPIYPYAHC